MRYDEDKKVVVKGFLGIEEAYSLKSIRRYKRVGKWLTVFGLTCLTILMTTPKDVEFPESIGALLVILFLIGIFGTLFGLVLYFESRRIEGVIKAKLEEQ